jgi:hypothetical protein
MKTIGSPGPRYTVKVWYIDGTFTTHERVEMVDFHDGFLALFQYETGMSRHINLSLIATIHVEELEEEKPSTNVVSITGAPNA